VEGGGSSAGERWAQGGEGVQPLLDKNGRTFEDPDGYRVVLQNAEWDG